MRRFLLAALLLAGGAAVIGGSAAAAQVDCPVPAYHSRPDLHPARMCVLSGTPVSGDVLLSTAGDGPTVYAADGQVVWHQAAPQPTNDLHVVTLHGRPYLAYWTGTLLPGGAGRGRYVLLDDRYRQVRTIEAIGYEADSHELLLTTRGTAILGSYNPVTVQVNGSPVTVEEYVVQEIDLRDNGVLFEWHSLDHVPVTASHLPAPPVGEYDYFHGNSIAIAPDGDLLIGARNTWSVYKVSRHSGRVLWTLGSPADGTGSFALTGGTEGWWCYQHDARMAGQRLELFDDGGSGPACAHASRAMTLTLDERARVATVVAETRHVPDLFAQFTGSTRSLVDGGRLVSWGNTGAVTEYAADGTVTAELKLDAFSYRIIGAEWRGRPLAHPDAVLADGHVYASWNGATGVAAWRVIGGPTVRRTGFETALPLRAGRGRVVVQALDASGHVMPDGTATTQ